MNKKFIFPIVSFLVLLIVFLTTEEKKENLTEEIFWKKNFDTVSYFPPAKDWSNEHASKFINKPFNIIRSSTGSFKGIPFFSVSYLDKNAKPITYEAGYNAKNLFTEISVLKIKSAVNATPEYLKKFEINSDKSPRLEVYEGKTSKKIIFGKENSSLSTNSLNIDSLILSINSYTIKRFITDLPNFRERQIISSGNGYIQKVKINIQGQSLEIENSPFKNKDGNLINSWSRTSGIRLTFDPALGDELDGLLKSIRYDLYPDEKLEDGLDIIRELTQNPTTDGIEVKMSDGKDIKIFVYPRTNIEEKDYIPVQRKIIGILDEFPGYVGVDIFTRIQTSAEKIRKAEKWHKPTKTIQ